MAAMKTLVDLADDREDLICRLAEMAGILRANPRELGRPEPVSIVSLGGTDARLWRQRGITAFVHGPFPRGMAQADEHVEIEEYLHIVRMHVLSTFDYLSR